jgi:uncharacterized membrane protein HdeD (DUF308 family)
MNPTLQLIRPWWVYGLRGALALAVGVLVLEMPGPMLLGVVGFCAAYGLIAGLMAVSAAMAFEDGQHRWLFMALGLGTLGAGSLAALYPGWAALALVLTIGLNALVTGLLDLGPALRTRHAPFGHWEPLRALISIVFGVLLLAWPGASALIMMWGLGAYAALIGLLYLALAIRVLTRRPPLPEADGAAPL